jgi:hypothetical protein
VIDSALEFGAKIQAADDFRHRRPDKFSMQGHAPV